MRLIVLRRLGGGRRFGRFAFALVLLLLQVDAFDRRHVGRIRQIRGHRIENRRDADAVQRRAAQHRLNLQVQRRFAEHLVDERLGNRLLGQRQLHQLVAVVVERFEQPLAPELGFAGQIFVGDIGRDDLVAFLAFGKREQLHRTRSITPRNGLAVWAGPWPTGICSATGLRTEPAADLLEHGFEVGPFAIELVDERQPRHFVLVRLPPNRFALRLDAFAGTEHHDAAIEHAQAPLDLGREIDVARRIDQIDDDVFPRELHAGRVDRDAALGFLGIVVGRGGAPIDFARAVLRAAGKQHALRHRRLARIDVGNDADVADFFEGEVISMTYGSSLSSQ